jgi:hypothetical protein
MVKRWKGEALRRAAIHGEPWLLLADEWFTRGGLGAPGRAFYPRDWSQIENGIGLLRRFQEHSRRFVMSERAWGFAGLRLLLLTGASFAPHLSHTVERLNRRVGSRIQVAAVHNATFGASVTVAGLLCGSDLLETAQRHMRCADGLGVDVVAVPSASVRIVADAGGGCRELQFLDDMTVAELRSELGLPIVTSGENLSRLLRHVRDGTGSSK